LTGPGSQGLKQKTRFQTSRVHKNFGEDNSRQLVTREYMSIISGSFLQTTG
jgi:hypothetical protein